MAKRKPEAPLKRSKTGERTAKPEGAINPFEQVFNLSPVLLAYLDRDFNFIAVNDAYAAAARKPKEFFPGKNHFSLYPHEENEAIFRRVVEAGEPFYISAKPFEHPDQPDRGTTYWDWSLVPVKDSNGKVEGLVFTLLDVTDRKRAENALDKHKAHLEEMVEARTADLMKTNVQLEQEIAERKSTEEKLRGSERRLKEAEQLALLGNWELDLTTNTLQWSDEVYRIFDSKPEEFGASYEAFVGMVHPDDREYVNKAYTDSVKNKTPYDIVHRLLMKDGTVKFVNERCKTYYDRDGNPLRSLGTVMDFTERVRAEEENKKLEEQLRHSQKMEALGLLAGGIAHDFNNRLAAIINFCHLAKMKLPEQSPAGKYLNQILFASKSAANLAHGLLAFSRKEVLNPGPVNLNLLITNFRDLLVRIIGEDIELDFKTSNKDLTVMADRGQLESVLLNLSINARDAMPKGGRFSISTRGILLDESFVKTHGYGRPGAYAVITVTDTGTGIDEATRQRIFEPFFTTKESGKGTGLGLSIVYGIVKQHDGHITCYSEPGKGTTFRIYLPLAPAALKKKELLAPLLPFAASGETVLLAEDDPGVREGIKALLEETGYRVIEAENGEDAVKKFGERTAEIALVILDVIMPRLNGREAYEKISRLKPGINVLFMTGYSGDHIRQGMLDEGAYYINKPVMPLEFLSKLRELLAK